MWFESFHPSQDVRPSQRVCSCTARLLLVENIPLTALQNFFETVNCFGDAQILNTRIEGDSFQSTVVYSDLREGQNALKEFQKVPLFQTISVSPVIETDFAVIINCTNASRLQREQMTFELSQIGAIAYSRVEPDISGGSQLFVYYYDSRAIQRVINHGFAVGTTVCHPLIMGVTHSKVCFFSPFNVTVTGSSIQPPNNLMVDHWSTSKSPWSATVGSSPPLAPSAIAPYCGPLNSTRTGFCSPPVEDYMESRWFSRSKRPSPTTDTSEGIPTPALPIVAKPSIWNEESKAGIESGLAEKRLPVSPASDDTPPATLATSPSESVKPSTPPVLQGVVTRDNVPYKNVVDLDLIDSGKETRTTVMLRNIPNKFSQKALKEFLDTTNKNTFNFLYLRMDFENHCNVGYAFISFTHPKHIATFARARCGQKWNMYKSEKLIDLSFAKIQGRASLIAKFRASPVMKEAPDYRPKLYYTSGPHIGEEEPFPAR
ncbi:Meiosis protein mei2 [Wickerhamiella sorbophila]|uniref:Meiosis protein mei2 n=1 Tax=Wickerhamiella sorbophila TaxID=45607 RepID=A0A2T0FGD0_9ASCO|nr:Meiosis protein mei2 [Wickerhamiella sorbophila]PRT54040.1 Meiosis protein mei2 [Wickerhamiella sorbophila]